MKQLIIGLCGQKRSGKNETAEYIDIEAIRQGYTTQQLSFAKPLKDMTKLMGFSEEAVNGDDKEIINPLYGKSARETLQWLGTDVFREQYDKDIWLKIIKDKITKCTDDVIIITDCRFDNEANLINELGGSVVQINRPGLESDDTSKHSSEQGITYRYVDASIDNIKDLDYLESEAITLFNGIKYSKEPILEINGSDEIDMTHYIYKEDDDLYSVHRDKVILFKNEKSIYSALNNLLVYYDDKPSIFEHISYEYTKQLGSLLEEQINN